MQLEEGKIYTLTIKHKGEKQGKKPVNRKIRMKLIKKYPHHAQFENTHGIRRSFTYWELGKLLNGESIEF